MCQINMDRATRREAADKRFRPFCETRKGPAPTRKADVAHRSIDVRLQHKAPICSDVTSYTPRFEHESRHFCN